MSGFSATYELTRARMIQAIDGLSDEQLRWRPHKDALSIFEMLMHVAGGDSEVARAAEALRELDGMEEVRTLDESVVVYTKDGARAIARIVLLLDEASVRMGEVTLAQPTLDDVFLRKTGHHIERDESVPQPAERP